MPVAAHSGAAEAKDGNAAASPWPEATFHLPNGSN